MRDVHTIPRLYEHLDRASPLCFALLEPITGPLDAETIQAVEARRIQESRYALSLGYNVRKAFKPPIRISGPQLEFPDWHHDDQIEYAVPSVISDEHTDLQLLTLQAGQTSVL